MISVQSLARQFANSTGRRAPPVMAVANVSFTAPDACITGLLGANGAGKTTTLRMVAGLLQPDAGHIRVDDLDVVAQPQAAQARLGRSEERRVGKECW